MIINRANRTALIGKNAFNEEGLTFLDFNSNISKVLKDYQDWKPITISEDAEYIVLITSFISRQGKNRTELVVLHIKTEEVVFSTKDFVVYDAILDKEKNQILLDTYNWYLIAVDLKTQKKTTVSKKKLRLYKGTFHSIKNEFYVPSETKEKSITCFSFVSGKTKEILVSELGKIDRIKFFGKKDIFLLLSNNVLYSFSANLKVKNWQLDFNELEDKPSRISHQILGSESQDFIFLSAPSTSNNNWGVDYCVDLEKGTIVNAIDNIKGRGRVAMPFFENEVFLYTGRVMNILSGEIRDFKSCN